MFNSGLSSHVGTVEMYWARHVVSTCVRWKWYTCVKSWTISYGSLKSKGGELRGTKTLNLSRNIVSLQFLGRCFAFFTLRDLSRNNKICSGLKKCSALIGWFAWCGSNMAAFVAWQVVSSMKNEQQSQNLLLKVEQRSNFRNTFLRPAKNVFVAGQVDCARWKTGNIDEILQRNDVARQVEGFCISYFAALKFGHFLSYKEVSKKLWLETEAELTEVRRTGLGLPLIVFMPNSLPPLIILQRDSR